MDLRHSYLKHSSIALRINVIIGKIILLIFFNHGAKNEVTI